MDSVICPEHPDCDKQTGAVHACGHHAQAATLLGIAAALKEPHILDGLCGKIRLCAVPAEELLEIEYRSQLRQNGTIKYFGGKSEFLHRGMFDGVDMALMVHTAQNYCVTSGMIGCTAKRIVYKGKAAHAGGAPWEGNNALYAAMCGLNAVNALRETFQENDLIRVHPIVTHGGDMVNAIPQQVCLESYVRGKTFEAIERENKKVNRAFISGALALGTNIEIVDMPGYAPLLNDENMQQLAKECAEQLMPNTPFPVYAHMGTGCTDMGDLSCIMPVVHPYCGGSTGTSHGKDYQITDVEAACITNAKWQILMVQTLLKNGASRAKEIVKGFKPRFKSKQAFLKHQDELFSDGERIVYGNKTTQIQI
jgi:amidohydrolase